MRRGSAGPKRQSMPLGQISKHEFHIGISLQDIAAPGSGEPNPNPLHFIKHDIVACPVAELPWSAATRVPRCLGVFATDLTDLWISRTLDIEPQGILPVKVDRGQVSGFFAGGTGIPRRARHGDVVNRTRGTG
jgi:hypothetical protein